MLIFFFWITFIRCTFPLNFPLLVSLKIPELVSLPRLIWVARYIVWTPCRPYIDLSGGSCLHSSLSNKGLPHHSGPISKCNGAAFELVVPEIYVLESDLGIESDVKWGSWVGGMAEILYCHRTQPKLRTLDTHFCWCKDQSNYGLEHIKSRKICYIFYAFALAEHFRLPCRAADSTSFLACPWVGAMG